MAKTRSPRYPNISLSEAISKARLIYEKEHMSALTPEVAAEAMGYSGINGASLKVISSLRKFGLLEGRGDDVRLTKDAQTLVIDDVSSADYKAAIERSALFPDVFSELRQQYPGRASERNISVYLEKQGFKPDAAQTTAKNYLETIALVEFDSRAYSDSVESEQDHSDGPDMPHTGSAGVQTKAPDISKIREGLTYSPDGPLPPWRVVQHGKLLEISAVVDITGLKKLKAVLESYEKILELMGSAEGPHQN